MASDLGRGGHQLRQPHEEDEGLEPYDGLPREIAARRSLCVTHRRFLVLDLGVPSEPQMREILATIRRALDADGVVYAQCWGGVRENGDAVGCLLLDDGWCRGDDVLERIAVLREGSEPAWGIASDADDDALRCGK